MGRWTRWLLATIARHSFPSACLRALLLLLLLLADDQSEGWDCHRCPAAAACAAPLPAPAPSTELPGMNKKDRYRAEYLARKASRPDLMINADQNACGPSTGPGEDGDEEGEEAKGKEDVRLSSPGLEDTICGSPSTCSFRAA